MTRRRTTLLVIFAILLIVALVIDWSMALTGVTATIIGGIVRVVLQAVKG